MLRRFAGPALLLAAAMARSTLCHAQDAQALFDEGLADMKAGRYKLGCALIKRSLEIDARPGTLFTLAECYSRAGKSASAMEMYDRFLAVYEQMPADQKAQQAARAELSRSERTRLVAQVSWLTVQLPDAAPPGVVVTQNGEPFNPGLFGVATAVDPGAHVFTARAPEGPLTEQRIDVQIGERRNIVLTVQLAGGLVPMPPEIVNDAPATRSITPWFWAAGGVGAAGLITGAVTFGMLLHQRSIIRSDCPESGRDPVTGRIGCKTQEGKDATELAQDTLAPATTIALGVGGAGTLVAVILLLTHNPHEPAPAARTLPTFEVTRGGATLGFSGTW